MMHPSDIEPRSDVPSHWRQVSFIAFDLGVMNIIAGVGVAFFYSVPLWYLGFRTSSIWLGMFFILAGLFCYRLRRLPSAVAITIIVIDALNTILRLRAYPAVEAVVLVKISFLLPLIFTLIWMWRLKLKGAKPEIQHEATPIGSGKTALVLLSSMVVSVGAGLTALLLFIKYALPPITESSNLLINIFHDLFLAPVFLFLFPLGLAIGELAWMQGSRLSSNELALFLRYVKQFPLISSLAERMMKKDESSITYQPASMNRHFWRKYVLVASVIMLPIISCFILIVGLIVPKALSEPAPEVAIAPSTAFVAPPDALVVSQNGDGQYRRIEDAVAAAPEGATIVVRPGVYHERVIIEKDITLVGDHKDRSGVVIKCYQGGCLSIIADRATIQTLLSSRRLVCYRCYLAAKTQQQ
jgi:hypothetical protein